jgi:16S rRNA (guanine527-N7)-methyltransferase
MNAVEGLSRLLAHYGFGPESVEAPGMLAYLELLEKWNTRINLTASTAWPAIGRLFEEALWAARFYPEGRCRHLDIGSGAGFPAIPLRMLRPEMLLTMVESRFRKAAFLETAAARLGLSHTAVSCGRIEEFLADPKDAPFDRVSWKAIKLSRKAFDCLLDSVGTETELWVFHGRELPFEDPVSALKALFPVRKERMPGAHEQFLSVFKASSYRSRKPEAGSQNWKQEV